MLSCVVPSDTSSATPLGTSGFGERSVADDSVVSPNQCDMVSPLSMAVTSVPEFSFEEGRCREAARLQAAPHARAPAKPRGDDRAESQGAFKLRGIIF